MNKLANLQAYEAKRTLLRQQQELAIRREAGKSYTEEQLRKGGTPVECNKHESRLKNPTEGQNND